MKRNVHAMEGVVAERQRQSVASKLSVDVIVRTLADARRSDLLFRALDSIRSQKGVEARPIVVVNGDRGDPRTLELLKNRSEVLLHRVVQASAGIAKVEGRRLVTADFFAYLDDDDELIPDSLREPLDWLESHPDCDVVISNGYFVKADGKLSELIHIADHLKTGDPALSLLEDSWLQPGAFVCRTKSIPPDMMSGDWSYMEWTRLAYEICAANKRLHFMDVPTVLYHDTPGSMSKQLQQDKAALELMRSIRTDSRASRKVRARANSKYHNILHVLAMVSLMRGDPWRAWLYHLASMQPPHTFKYLLFSRKLLWPKYRGGNGSPG